MSLHVEVIFPPPFHNGSRTCTSAKAWRIDNPLRGAQITDKQWNNFVAEIFHAWSSNTWGTLCDIMVCLTVVGIPVLICKETRALDMAQRVVERRALSQLKCTTRCSRTTITEAVGAVKKLVVVFTPVIESTGKEGELAHIVVHYDSSQTATSAQGIAGAWQDGPSRRMSRGASYRAKSGEQTSMEASGSLPQIKETDNENEREGKGQDIESSRANSFRVERVVEHTKQTDEETASGEKTDSSTRDQGTDSPEGSVSAGGLTPNSSRTTSLRPDRIPFQNSRPSRSPPPPGDFRVAPATDKPL